MDPPGRNGRPYGLPSGPASGMRPGIRPPPISSPASQPLPPASQMTRAEKFADDKRKIILSCFAKTEPDGQPAESYITHIRITEDGRHPQSPPPPSSGPENKKERVIILAVRSTGRVRMHKARENANGSFSIGKTWNFEEVSAVQSFTDFKPQGQDEEQWAQWAGENGFMVTVGKPYFWHTNSMNEKIYFIASLLKVYNKYTSGQLPQLSGFAPRELDEVLAQVDQTRSSGPATPSSVQSFGAGANRVKSPFSPNGSTRGPISPVPQPSPPRSGPPAQPPPMSARRANFNQDGRSSPAIQPPDSLRPQGLRQATSRDQMRPYGSQTPPTTAGRITPQASSIDLAPKREGTPDSLRPGGGGRRGGGFFQPPEAPSSRDGPPSNGLGISSNAGGLRAVNGDRYQANGSSDSLPQVVPTPLPERRRPPMASPPLNDSRFGNDSGAVMPRPLQPSNRSFDQHTPPEPPAMEVPPKSPERMNSRKVSISEKIEKPIEPLRTTSEVKPIEEVPKASEPEKLATPATSPPAEDSDGISRPGLGRMFGGQKKSAKEMFKSAANAYGAFKPRAGGAAAKILLAGTESKTNEPDGITGVVPAPGLNRTKTTESMKTINSDQNSIQQTPTSATATKSLPDLKVTSPKSPDEPMPNALNLSKAAPATTTTTNKMSDLQQKAAELQQKSKAEEEEAARRKVRRTPQQLKYLDRLGVDSSLLEGRGLEYEALLEEFWPQDVWHTKPVENLQAEIRRELSRVQTGSWFEHIALHDEERNAAIKLIDNAVEECDVLEKLLTIYSVELGSLSDDIAYIEAQGQGLQVQTSNQKLLMTELQDLLDAVNVPSQQMDPIYNSNVISLEGLESVERAVLSLYKALVLTDPSLRTGNATEQAAEYTQLSKMRALQEKRNGYLDASQIFLTRFKNYMDIIYGQAAMEIESHAKNDPSKVNSTSTITVSDVNAGRATLWKYSPLVLFAKSMDRNSWLDLISGYQTKMRTVYSESLNGTFQNCKKMARGNAGEEQDLLFTINENQPDGLAISARKLTVKRSGTLARTLRAASGEKPNRQSNSRTGTLFPSDAVADAIQDIAPLLLTEQAFIVDFFHASTTETVDFVEAAQAALPENRQGNHDLHRKTYEPNSEMNQLVSGLMSDMFSFLPTELQNLVNWAVNMGPLQGVGILNALHKAMDGVEDGFFYRTLHSLSTKLTNDWTKFLNLQVRAIEDTKVKIKKRKGVIYFMKIFPSFSGHVENLLPEDRENVADEVRTLVDQGYQQLIKAMFESLRAIAKESPSSAPHAVSNDPEDKEALNYHILLIENMNHYVEYVDTRGNEVLSSGKTKANDELDEHLSLYVDAVLRRPLGKLMDFMESLNHAIEAKGAHTSLSNLASNPTFSPSTFKKLVSAYDARELRRGVDALRKRVEKHFGDADEQEISRNLVVKVLGACEERFAREIEKVQTQPKPVYGDDFVSVPASRDEIAKWFKGAR
ncbi:hypothetical protein BT63DRAFT_436359 [Microthyrium microscopicum]|uniref:Exocyst complex component Sec3 PIP2-binding N-terminal domain-containing protein n=1 Tax=Microthyrium microscopicum TaxID=703497 RepID=A0A6A6UVK7_9PEZI|nr:hypothetical protein BT63DRAFT_436359 [Microthyrium microscopicum]